MLPEPKFLRIAINSCGYFVIAVYFCMIPVNIVASYRSECACNVAILDCATNIQDTKLAERAYITTPS